MTETSWDRIIHYGAGVIAGLVIAGSICWWRFI